jgi:uncharacterized membrane protein YebE (DUF533 family)
LLRKSNLKRIFCVVDVTSILTSILSGGQSNHSNGQLGGLGDILGQLTRGQADGGQAQGAPSGDILGQLGNMLGGATSQTGQSGGGIGDILGQLTGGGNAGQAGGLGDILGQLTGGQSGGLGSILGQLAGGGAGQSSGGIGDILGQLTGASGGTQNGGGLGDILGQLTGGNASQGANGADSGILGQLGSLLGGASSGGNSSILGTLISSGALAGLAGAVLGGGGKAAATHAAKIGGLAILANLAMKALAGYRSGAKPGATTLTHLLNQPHQDVTPEFDANTTATLMLRAMVAASYADGEMDASEKANIVGQLHALGVDEAQQAFIDGLLNNPVNVATLTNQISNDETKAQVYLAACQAINVDTDEEVEFLNELASGFGFDKKLKAHLDHASDAAKANV